MALLRQVQQNDRFGLGTKRGIGQGSCRGEQDGDADHDPCQHFGELFWFLHGFRDGDDESNALEREH